MRSCDTLCELEVANASPPVKRRRCGIIFLRVPKRTVIYRIHTHLTVVSPPIASSSLATCSVEEMSLALGESIYWIAREPPGASNLGINCGIRCAETYSQIALAIHRSTTHPAPGSVRLIGALLEDRWCGGDIPYFEPTHTANTIRTYSVVSHHCFVAIGKLTICKSEHQTVADFVQTSSLS